MKIAVLPRNPKRYSTRRLVEAAQGAVTRRVLDVPCCYMEVNTSPGLEGIDPNPHVDPSK